MYKRELPYSMSIVVDPLEPKPGLRDLRQFTIDAQTDEVAKIEAEKILKSEQQSFEDGSMVYLSVFRDRVIIHYEKFGVVVAQLAGT
jgi:hypothetical protein